MAVRALQSRVRLTSPDGAQTIAFPYKALADDHVKGYINGVEDTALTHNLPTDVTFTDTISIGDEVLVKRVTPAHLSEQLTNFTLGSTVSQDDFDKLQQQLLYLIQETMDDAIESASNRNEDTELDCDGKVVKNAGAAVDGSDLVTKTQLDTASISGSDLPAPGSNDSFMVVNGGAWEQRTKAQVQAHLSLGTAAYVNTGSTSGDLVLLDSNDAVPLTHRRNVLWRGPNQNSTCTNSASATWLTDAAGVNFRVGFVGTAIYDPDGDISSTGGPFFLGFNINTAGTYRITWVNVFQNQDAAIVGNPKIAMTNVDGTVIYVPELTPGVMEHGDGTGHQFQTFISDNVYTFAGGETVYPRRKNNSATGNVVVVGEGSYIYIERLA